VALFLAPGADAAAVLGQDVLLEPCWPCLCPAHLCDHAHHTIWGTCYLVSISGLLEGKIARLTIARLASWAGVAAFALVGLSGLLGSQGMFYAGLVLLGLATGPATVSNLALMLDMTVPGKVGLFIGAWGSASAFARLLGAFTTAGVRDLARLAPQAAVLGTLSALHPGLIPWSRCSCCGALTGRSSSVKPKCARDGSVVGAGLMSEAP
jgi:BCD family chlorophyll transporter-like MFS transporter